MEVEFYDSDDEDMEMKSNKKSKTAKKKGALNNPSRRKAIEEKGSQNVAKMFQKLPETTSGSYTTRFTSKSTLDDDYMNILLKDDEDDGDLALDEPMATVPDNSMHMDIESETKTENTFKHSDEGFDDDDFDFSTMDKLTDDVERDVSYQKDVANLPQLENKKTMELPFDEAGELLVYWFDAAELKGYKPGNIYVFGKILDPSDKVYRSICVTVKNITRKLYVCPRPGVPMEDVEKEIEELRKKYHITRFVKVQRVHKLYSFEIEGVPKGDSEYLEIEYGFDEPSFPNGIQGKTFVHIFGKTCSALETFIMDRKLMGPGWLNVKNAKKSTLSTWCSCECTIENINDIENKEFKENVTIPPTPNFIVMAIKAQHIPISKDRTEIAMVSLVVNTNFNVEMPQNNTGMDMTFLRKIRNEPLPLKFEQMAKKNRIYIDTTESNMLKSVMDAIGKYDPDFLIGHSVINFDLALLLSRMKALKISNWSLLGRFKRNKFPTIRKSDPSYEVRNIVSGRLICDSYLLAKELLPSQRDYKLSSLSKSQLNIVKEDIVADAIPKSYEHLTSLLQLCSKVKEDAILSEKLVLKLDAISLMKQLTNLSGNLWSRSLNGARAERIEYLLMHKFYALNYIIPDKVESTDKGRKAKSKYKGGYVIDPVPGFYSDFVIVLDFNSLYPSLIQEYNVCFTTVDRSKSEDGKWRLSEPPEPTVEFGILPKAISELVNSRREVKSKLEREKDPIMKQRLNVKQLAIKLIANSMYGCLGFEHSRFFALPLAELITRKGRDALQIAQNISKELNLDVIYGDTDSIMINTRTKSFRESREIGTKLKKNINRSFKKLEIDIDGIFEKILLLRKKKYAALVCKRTGNTEEYTTTRVEKGIDTVRRDWCKLFYDIGKELLDEIFSGKSDDDIVDCILELLTKLGERIKNNQVPLDKFVMTKSLTKNPEEYEDAKTQPHVKVAKDLQSKNINVHVGDIIEYIICKGEKGASLAERAKAVSEVTLDDVDYTYYLEYQVYPPVLRLCQCLQIQPSEIARCLGLDESKFQEREVASMEMASLIHSSEDFSEIEDKFKVYCKDCNTFLEYVRPRPCDHIHEESRFLKNQIRLYIRKQVTKLYQSPYILNGWSTNHWFYVKKNKAYHMTQRLAMKKKFDENKLCLYFRYLKSLLPKSQVISEYEALNSYGVIDLAQLFKF